MDGRRALFTGADSPVSADSSALSPSLSTTRPSATSLSPPESRRISPATTASFVSSTGSPPRIALTLTLSYISLSAANAFSELLSIKSVMPTESAMARKIPIHSIKSPSPVLSALPIFVPSVMTKLKIRMSIIGSASASPMRAKKPLPFFFFSTLAPYFKAFSFTAAAPSPLFTSLLKWSITFCAFSA